MDRNIANIWTTSLTDGTPLKGILESPATPRVLHASDFKRIPTLHVGSAYRFGNLTWFPVWTDEPVAPRRYATATTAKFVVAEAENASVPTLQVANQADQDLLLLEGMILEGGWQHRALTQTVVVPARSRGLIPVVCVEQQRWGGSATQDVGSKLAPTAVRVSMRGLTKDTRGNISQAGPDQDRVWRNVAEYQSRAKASAPTQSLADIHDEVVAQLESLPKPVALPGQRGVVVAGLGQPIALELFDHPDTMAERLPGLLESYLLDVVDKPYTKVKGQTARDFVLQVSKLKLQNNPERGSQVRLQSANSRYVAAAGLAVDGGLVHLSCINSQHELVLAA